MNQLQLYVFKGYYENHIDEPVKWFTFLRLLTTNTYIQRDICIIIIQLIYKH